MPEHETTASFDAVKERLERIAEEVAQEDIPLDEALALYEEAVLLGLSACDLSEADLAQADAAAAADGEDGAASQAPEGASDGEADDAPPAAAPAVPPAAQVLTDTALPHPGSELG